MKGVVRVEIVYFILLLMATLVAIAVGWRFTNVRNSGVQGIIRMLPADGAHGWRHGVLRYAGEEARFYKLRSLSFNYDSSLDRRTVTFHGIRDLTEDEKEFMPGVEGVLQLSGPQGDFEFAGDRHAEMALISWVESAPDSRAQRADMNELAERAQRNQ